MCTLYKKTRLCNCKNGLLVNRDSGCDILNNHRDLFFVALAIVGFLVCSIAMGMIIGPEGVALIAKEATRNIGVTTGSQVIDIALLSITFATPSGVLMLAALALTSPVVMSILTNAIAYAVLTVIYGNITLSLFAPFGGVAFVVLLYYAFFSAPGALPVAVPLSIMMLEFGILMIACGIFGVATGSGPPNTKVPS